MIRLFTAIEIPSHIRAALSRLQQGLPGARWIEPENFHITLCFIGEVSEDVASDIDETLAGLDDDAFDLHLTGLGQFGNDKPRALWAGVSDSPDLRALQAHQEAALKRIGLRLERRKYTPHVTLARFNQIEPATVWRFIESNNLFETLPFRVTRSVLFSSRLSQGGGPYVAERLYDLTDRAPEESD